MYALEAQQPSMGPLTLAGEQRHTDSLYSSGGTLESWKYAVKTDSWFAPLGLVHPK
jgi:hypothetical protein